VLQAVTFDFWDTLVIARQDAMRDIRIDGVGEILAAAGRPVARGVVADAIDEAAAEFRRAWGENRQFGAEQAVPMIVDALGIKASDDLTGRLVEIIQNGDPEPEMTPNSAATLRALKLAGIRLGIICDVGFSPSTRLRGHLERFGVLRLFDHWSFSDDVGQFKPSPLVFEHAHRGLGVREPAAAAHVGDLRRTDIAGARGFGSISVRYAGIVDDQGAGPEADHVITDHAQLLDVLGVGR
jgi:FMN phosphatase YigB (HAD superfamily)